MDSISQFTEAFLFFGQSQKVGLYNTLDSNLCKVKKDISVVQHAGERPSTWAHG
jgi:hypothetical protein